MAFGKGTPKWRKSQSNEMNGNIQRQIEEKNDECVKKVIANIEGCKLYDRIKPLSQYSDLGDHVCKAPSFIAFLSKTGTVRVDEEPYDLGNGSTARNIYWQEEHIGYLEYYSSDAIIYHGKIPRMKAPKTRGNIRYANPQLTPIVLIYNQKVFDPKNNPSGRQDKWSKYIPFP